MTDERPRNELADLRGESELTLYPATRYPKAELGDTDPDTCWTYSPDLKARVAGEHDLRPYVLVNDGMRLFGMYRDVEPALYTFQCTRCGQIHDLTLRQAAEQGLIVAMEVSRVGISPMPELEG